MAFLFQLRPSYVVCSFIFLLLGLACFASSVNLLVLRFMIISLEEEEDQQDLHDAAQNVVTLDDEVQLAVNGRAGAGGGGGAASGNAAALAPFDPAAYLGGNGGFRQASFWRFSIYHNCITFDPAYLAHLKLKLTHGDTQIWKTQLSS